MKSKEKYLRDAIDSERAVLSAILRDNRIIFRVLDILEPSDFSIVAHQVILAAMIELAEESRPCNLDSLTKVLGENGELETAGDRRYVKELLNVDANPEHIDDHCNAVLKAGIARELAHHCKCVEKDVRRGRKELDELLDEALLGILAAYDRRVKPFFFHLGTLLEEYGSSVERNKPGGPSLALLTGNPDFDRLTGGLRGGELIMLAGYPCAGKTALALDIAHHVATSNDIPTSVALFTPSLKKETLVLRFLSKVTGIETHQLRHGGLSDSETKRVKEGISVLKETAIFIDDTPRSSASEIQAKVRIILSEKLIGLVIVDSSAVGPQEYPHIAELTFSLKIMAKSLNIPVLFVVEAISDSALEDKTQAGTIQELKEFLGWPYIERDIDVAIFALSHNRDRVFGKPEFIVVRNRLGSLGRIVIGEEIAHTI